MRTLPYYYDKELKVYLPWVHQTPESILLEESIEEEIQAELEELSNEFSRTSN